MKKNIKIFNYFLAFSSFAAFPTIAVSCKNNDESILKKNLEISSSKTSHSFDKELFGNVSRKGNQYELQKLVRKVERDWDIDLNQLWNSITGKHTWADIFIDRFDPQQREKLLPWSSKIVNSNQQGRIVKNPEKVEIDNNYKETLMSLNNFLLKNINDLDVDQKLPKESFNNIFSGAFKYKIENPIRNVNDFFVNFVKLDSPEYLSDIWTNVFFANQYSEVEEYVSQMESTNAKDELMNNLLPKIKALFDNNADDMGTFSVAIIPTYNDNMYIRNMYYNYEKGNLIAKMSFLNNDEISENLSLLIVPVSYAPKYMNAFFPWTRWSLFDNLQYQSYRFANDVHYSRHLSSKFLDIDNFVVKNKRHLKFEGYDSEINIDVWLERPYMRSFEWTTLTYTANLYFDNLFYCYLDHFINGQSYTVENLSGEQLENKFVKFLSYKLQISELDTQNFFNKIKNFEKLNENEIPLLKKWVTQDFKDYDSEINLWWTY
ncbi:variable surface lipoprotein [Mycoplasmopsis gallinacea]|uniref:Lipoprotein n=1 Tax=Mycoplasmopsis gallinacea TaxID=29556 RepID=A0A6H0V4F0_9BACT|nr:variable surface lipoprotein [Mycoplasmopsis gallinacea]QIW61897.1 hypothetical protein GOQ20_00195 [Mycoplasmopsis gallinacea]